MGAAPLGPHRRGQVRRAGAAAPAGGERADHARPGAGAGGGGGHSAASAREESSRLVSGALQMQNVSPASRRRGEEVSRAAEPAAPRPAERSVSACAPASASGRGWARGRVGPPTPPRPGAGRRSLRAPFDGRGSPQPCSLGALARTAAVLRPRAGISTCGRLPCSLPVPAALDVLGVHNAAPRGHRQGGHRMARRLPQAHGNRSG